MNSSHGTSNLPIHLDNIERFGGKFLVSKEVLADIENAKDDGFDLLTKVTPQQINNVMDSVFKDAEIEIVCSKILKLLKYKKGNTFSPFTLKEYQEMRRLGIFEERIISMLVEGDDSWKGDKMDKGYLVRNGEDIYFTNKFIKAFVKQGIYDREKANNSNERLDQISQIYAQRERENTNCELLLNLIATAIKKEDSYVFETAHEIEQYVEMVTGGGLSMKIDDLKYRDIGKLNVDISAHPGLFPNQQNRNFAGGFNTRGDVENDTLDKLVQWLKTFDKPAMAK